MSPEKMIELVMSGRDTDFSQELCAAFANGFPLTNLRPLLMSDDPKILGLGSYLIYELGGRARGLLDDIVALLGKADPQVRSDAINAIGECATRFDAVALGKVIELLDDPDPFVQRMVMRFIQSCERDMLVVGIHKAAEMNPSSIFEEFPSCLVKRVFSLHKHVPISAETLDSLLSHDNPVANRFGVGLATRPRYIVDETFVDKAAEIDDEECRNFVKWTRERPCLAWAETMRL